MNAENSTTFDAMARTEAASLAGKRAIRLGIVGATNANVYDGRLFVHATFGRIVQMLVDRYERVVLSTPVTCAPPPESRDYALPMSSIDLAAQPGWTSSAAALRHPLAIMYCFERICRTCDVVFIRGLQPWLQYIYLRRLFGGPPIVHWLVGDPVHGMRADRECPLLKRHLLAGYCLIEQHATRLAARLTGTALLANGARLACKYQTPNTHAVVSTAIYEREIRPRIDTCDGPAVRVLYVGFIRPGKGLSFLIGALPKLRSDRRVELIIVGAAEKYGESRRRAEAQIRSLDLTDRVTFAGYVAYGAPLFEQMRRADVLVLPSLSEGTPRTLVDARAQGLPIISTDVGGVPTSVTHEHDGLLVPPADENAIAAAIDRMIEDGALRRRLIANGLRRAHELTLERFVDRLCSTTEREAAKRSRRAPGRNRS
ncbi:MAG: glycosyltransferase family 4 protein [Phycisphaerae bacterium]